MQELELIQPATKLLAVAKTSDGKEVTFGYKKSAHIIQGLLDKPVGHKFNAEIAVSSTSGRLYNADSLDVAEAYWRVERMQLQKTILVKQTEAFS